MSSSQPPYYASSFGDPTQHPNRAAPIGTQMGGTTSTGDPQTGPAPTTAGPHRSNVMNKLDPRVDSDLNNRAQYAPGTTTSGNVHPQTAQDASLNESSNAGPHRSAAMNKLDPRVDSESGEMSTKTTNQTGSGTRRTYTDTSGSAANTAGTGSYDAHAPYSAGYSGAMPNAAGYARSGVRYQESPPSNSASGTHSASKGQEFGRGIKSTLAGIHGAGESLRGNFNAAVDEAVGHKEGVAKNSGIAQQGEREISSGQFQRSHHH
ncbi:predicted protein [Aspergillus terreus NIH2624]|uniref:Uncharacterized protein n=1 Tax=Aspergillus terreus (strain NIH 2624 / FGSC A1156) TaxID=341663 RepID=Q0CPP3_ASPTN|nr:uncharacterized protein ATEG_04341 [Aspergillus terreus NIH2624]EAU34788.1 predicted protein [Aspergillus terreus NIH2624]